MRLDAGVVDNLRETHPFLRGDDLPRHPSVQRQHVHLHAMLVHPFAALIDVELEREGIAERLPEIRHGLRIRRRHPVRVKIDGDGAIGGRARGAGVPPWLHRRLRRRGVRLCRSQGA